MSNQSAAVAAGDTTVPGRPAGATHGDAAYWARIRRIASEAPPLSERQRAVVFAAFHQPVEPKEQAA